MNKKANAIALILLAITGILITAVYLSNTLEIPTVDKTTSTSVQAQAQISLASSIRLGVLDLMGSGYSNNSKLWYCNAPYLPNSAEVLSSAKEITKNRFVSTLEQLNASSNLIYSDPKIDFLFNANRHLLDSDTVSISVNDFKIGVSGDNSELQEYDLKSNYTLNWKTWMLYNGLANWTEKNAGGVTDLLRGELEKVPCQATGEACECEPAGARIIKQSTIDKTKLKIDNVTTAIDKSVVLLQQEFVGTPVVCSYKILKYNLDHKGSYAYSRGGNYSPVEVNSSGAIDKLVDRQKGKDYELVDNLQEPFTKSSDACLNESRQNTSVVTGIIADKPYWNRTLEGRTTEFCAKLRTDTRILAELYTTERSVAVLYEVTCVDPTELVQTSAGVSPLSASMQLRIAVIEACNIPDAPSTQTFSCAEGAAIRPACDRDCGICNECSRSVVNGIPQMKCVPSKTSSCGTSKDGVFTPGGSEYGCGACQVASANTYLPNGSLVPEGVGYCAPKPPGEIDPVCQTTGPCAVCNGVDIGPNSCMNDTVKGYANKWQLVCPGTCGVCNLAGSCAPPAVPLGQMNSNVCDACESCGVAPDGSAACLANTSRNGDLIPNLTCQACLNGKPIAAPDGRIDNKCNLNGAMCNVCVGGSCAYDPVIIPKSSQYCGFCEQCGNNTATGLGMCISNSSRDGWTCNAQGNTVCNACTNGSCLPSLPKLGTQCAGDKECIQGCAADGSCTDGSLTNGNMCTNTATACFGNLGGTCSAQGNCVPLALSGMKCCGTNICNANEECCPYGGPGFNVSVCGACPDGTT